MKKYLLPLLLIPLQCSIAQSPMPRYRLAEERLPACFDDLLRCNCIREIYQDKKGFMWFATPLGLIRFDGYDFKYFRHDPSDKKTIGNNNVLRLAEDKAGNIWAGLNENGISCYDPVSGVFTNYNTSAADSSSQGAIVSIFIDEDNEVWFSPGYAGLCHLDKKTKRFDTYKIVTTKNCPHLSESSAHLNNFVMDIKRRDKNNLWLATPEGLFSFDKQKGISVPIRARPVDTSKPVDYNARRIITDGNLLWIGGWASGIRSYDTRTGKWEQYFFASRNQSVYTDNIIYDMMEKSASEIWIASADKGLGIFNKHTKKTLFFRDDSNYSFLPKTFANLIFRDRQENAWVGFENGFYKFIQEADQVEPHKINAYENQNSGLSITNSVFEDASGRYELAGTSYADGIVFTDRKLNQTITIPVTHAKSGTHTMHVNGFIQKDSSSAWVLCNDLLLTLDLTSRRLSLPPQPAAKKYEWGENNYSSFLRDDNNNLWISTPLYGIICYHIKDGNSDIYSTDSNNPSNSIATNTVGCIAYDKKGRLWYGSSRSFFLGYYDTKSKTNIILDKNGNPCDRAHSIKTYDFLKVGGNIYAATEAGLLEFDCSGNKPQLKNTINAGNGIGADWVKAAAIDRNGNFWLLTALGVCQYDPLTKALVTLNKNNGIYKQVLGISYTQRKTIYLTGINYYYRIMESHKPIASRPVTPVITALKINETEVNPDAMLSKDKEIKIPANYSYFSFGYASPDMSNAEQTNYSYMLEGFDKDWIDAGNRRFVNYTNLPGGNYVFKVRSSLGKENKYSAITEVPLFIGTLFHRTIWFRALIVLSILLILYAIYRYRLNKQMEINRLNNRAHILEKEKTLVQYEILKQQLNPHFLFNSLAALSGLIATEPGMARTFLEKMTRIYRYILRSSNNELVRLSDEINFAATYINLQETRFKDGLKVNIDVNEDYDGYKIVPVTIQNMIENAIKHNIISSNAPLIIDIIAVDGYLVVKNNLQKKARVETSNKLGLTQLKTLYGYLSDKPVIIEETNKDFTIKIPLV